MQIRVNKLMNQWLSYPIVVSVADPSTWIGGMGTTKTAPRYAVN
jgi:hypothetical protein